ncbi:MAG TPA: hypothetical protein H9672_07680 [Firmicutes bacterium]|nr:hypothetical protein [Bacillota bacterium]
MSKSVSRKYVILFLCLTALITGVLCFLVYRNTFASTPVRLSDYEPCAEEAIYGIQYSGELKQSTVLSNLETSDEVTQLSYISGSSHTADYLEFDGYIYIPEESNKYFNTEMLLCKKGEDQALALKTYAETNEWLTDHIGNDTYNYDYAFFRSVISKSDLETGAEYQVFFLFGNDLKTQELVETAYTVKLDDSGELEVTNEAE